jgi:hypothetical protein
VKSVGTNAHFGPKAEFPAIGKARTGVPVNTGTVDLGKKLASDGLVRRNNGVGVMGAQGFDVADGSLQAIDHFDIYNKFEVLGAVILIGGSFRRRNKFLGLLTASDFSFMSTQSGTERR